MEGVPTITEDFSIIGREETYRGLSYSVLWNCFLIVSGTTLYAIGLKGIAVPHNFIPGGLYGISLAIYYLTKNLSPAILFALMNIPIFILGYIFLSRRFVLYSFLGMINLTVVYTLFPHELLIKNELYAAVASGVVTGAGAGIVLRSLGSGGGFDILGVIMFQKFNIGLGKFYFTINFLLFAFCFFSFDADLVIASMIMVFVASVAMDYCLSMFNQRKMVFVISDKTSIIADAIIKQLKLSATFIEGKGAYSDKSKQVLLTIINNVQLKRLEEIVFTNDNKALFIVENTFNVIGSSFSKRKLY